MTEDLLALALTAAHSSRAAVDPDYPVFHVVPPVGRLNDPNGLVVDGGTYHAFYQYSPFHPHRKLVFWGHSSSPDLVHWTHHDPAVVPDSSYDRSGAYSGACLPLEDGELDSAPEGARFLLYYSGNLKDPVTDARTASQCLVTSADLVEFTKWPGNPLLSGQPEGYTSHFRDPQVWRDPERPGSYRMIVGVQRDNLTGAAVLYRSEDLLTWDFEGELTFPDAGEAFDSLGYMWECPGIVRLTDELSGQEHDVLIWCPQGIRPESEGWENIYPVAYTVGHLVGNELRGCDGTFHEVDRGFEYYAPQVFARRPSEPGPALLVGWAGNAEQDDHPSITTGGWVHALTAPRELALRGGRLIQRPALRADHGAELDLAGRRLEAGQAAGACATEPLAELDGHRSWHVVLQVDRPREPWGLRIGDDDCHVDIGLRPDATGTGARLVVDRSRSRYTTHGTCREVTLPEGAAGRLEVLHDRSVTEVVVGDGDIVFTFRSYLAPGASGATLYSRGTLSIDQAHAVVYD